MRLDPKVKKASPRVDTSFEQLLTRKRHIIMRKQVLEELDQVAKLLSCYPHGTMYELSRGEVVIGIRHDMDAECENAAKLARWEAANGVKATYYPLHTEWYYRHNGKLTSHLLSALDTIASCGHEIGLHNNCVAAWLAGRSGNPASILEYELDELRALGYDIKGTAKHGDPLCHGRDLPNDQVFTECVTKANRKRLDWDRPMKSFGLEYEAYHVPFWQYLSDSGGVFNQRPCDVRTALKSGGNAAVLMHPMYWRIP